MTKAVEERTPMTRYRSTANGRQALERYRRQMVRSRERGKAEMRAAQERTCSESPGPARAVAPHRVNA